MLGMNGKPWTDEEVNSLELHYRQYGLKGIRIPGRSYTAIKHKLSALLISQKPTIEDFRKIMASYPGRTISWYARKMGVHKNTAAKYVNQIRSSNEKK